MARVVPGLPKISRAHRARAVSQAGPTPVGPLPVWPRVRGRALVFGDHHAELEPINRILDHLSPGKGDRICSVGDFTDCGSDSSGVIDRMMEIQRKFPGSVITDSNHDHRHASWFRDYGYEEKKREPWDTFFHHHRPISPDQAELLYLD